MNGFLEGLLSGITQNLNFLNFNQSKTRTSSTGAGRRKENRKQRKAKKAARKQRR